MDSKEYAKSIRLLADLNPPKLIDEKAVRVEAEREPGPLERQWLAMFSAIPRAD